MGSGRVKIWKPEITKKLTTDLIDNYIFIGNIQMSSLHLIIITYFLERFH